MHRTDGANNSSNQFVDRNVGSGVPGTVVEKDWLNGVQETLCQAIEASGQALAKGTHTQLRDAIRKLATTVTTSRTLVLDIGGTPANRIRGYAVVNATAGLCVLEIVVACSWNGTNWVPDSSGALCSKFEFFNGRFGVYFFTATGTTPFADSSFSGSDSRMYFDTISLNTTQRATFSTPSGSSNPVLSLFQGGTQKGHLYLAPLASAPSSPVEGEVYYNGTDHKLYVRTNSAWVVVGTQT